MQKIDEVTHYGTGNFRGKMRIKHVPVAGTHITLNVIDRVASGPITSGEDNSDQVFYLIESCISSRTNYESGYSLSLVDANRVAEMFFDVCPCGHRTDLRHGLAGYMSLRCRNCGTEWDAATSQEHDAQVADYIAQEPHAERLARTLQRWGTATVHGFGTAPEHHQDGYKIIGMTRGNSDTVAQEFGANVRLVDGGTLYDGSHAFYVMMKGK
jgi:hypothetical protein